MGREGWTLTPLGEDLERMMQEEEAVFKDTQKKQIKWRNKAFIWGM